MDDLNFITECSDCHTVLRNDGYSAECPCGKTLCEDCWFEHESETLCEDCYNKATAHLMKM